VGVGRAGRWLLAAQASIVALGALAAAPVAAAEPPGYEYFHTYAETEAAIDAAVAQHPDIARKFSIGSSYRGRSIWGIELTSNIAAGSQGRPEVLIDGLTHARERASSELAIYIIGILTDNYGLTTKLGQRVTAILDTRVVYIVPMVNPDGAVYDFKGDTFHRWRKNRQPIPGSTAIGIDLNRNFGFKWGCCGGSSGDPSSDFYRGPSAWYAPEAVALRDFINSRVVDGAQRITETLSLHSAARLVLWPYGYTRTDVPSTMTADDHLAFVALGKGMGQRNGYVAQQGSDLYITDGDAGDWAYHSNGIFAIVIEMAKGSAKRYYPSKSELDADLARNRPAVLWFLEQADCPYRAAGLATQYCGAHAALSRAAARPN
jgi:carboxypeptidase T